MLESQIVVRNDSPAQGMSEIIAQRVPCWNASLTAAWIAGGRLLMLSSEEMPEESPEESRPASAEESVPDETSAAGSKAWCATR